MRPNEIYLRFDRAEVEPLWTWDNRTAERQANQGSRELREALEKCIFKFGFRYGITTDEARHLLLNKGVRL